MNQQTSSVPATSFTSASSRQAAKRSKANNSAVRSKRLCMQLTDTSDFTEIDSSLEREAVWFYRKSVENFASYRDFLRAVKPELVARLAEIVGNRPIKYNLKLETSYHIPRSEAPSEDRAFKTWARALLSDTDIGCAVDEDFEVMIAEEDAYSGRGSGFTLTYIDSLMLSVYKYTPLAGSSYIPVPPEINQRKAIINPQNIDQSCFKWSILARHVSGSNKYRVNEKYFNEEHRCLRTGITIVFGDIDGPVVNGYFTLATETYDDDGIPHTLEHLIFLGSEDYPYKGVLDLLSNRCLASGTNAYTAVDHTCYTVSTAGSEGFLSLLPIYLDHILYPTLTDSGFITQVHHITSDGKDAGVVYCELKEVENTAENIVRQSLLKKIYPGKCGYKSVHGGIMKNLRESTTIEKIRKYHQAYYRPENLLLLVTGKIDHFSFFNSLEPVIQKILSKGSRGEYIKPWQNPVDPLTESSNYVELFPCDKETNGYINIGWRGPVGSTYSYKYKACEILLRYLTTIQMKIEFVQISDPLCSQVTFNISNNLNPFIKLVFNNVPIRKLDEKQIPLKLNEVFKKLINDEDYFDLEELKKCIKKFKLIDLRNLESGFNSILPFLIIFDFLYGKNKSDLDEILNTKRIFNKLLSEDILFWKNILRDYLLNDHKVIVRGIPSIKKHNELANEEIQRVSQRKKDLGDDGLKLKANELLNAIKECEKKPPSEMLTSIKIPNVDLIQFLTHDTFSSNSIYQHNLFKTSEVPLFVEIDNVKSNFVNMRVLINTKDLALNLRKYLPTFLDLIINSPSIRRDKIYTNVNAKLDKDIIHKQASIGICSKSFTFGYFSSVIFISVYVKLDKYHKGIKWLHDILYNTVITKKWFSIMLSKKINEISSYRRNGRDMVDQILINMMYKKDNNPYACSALRQYKFLTKLQNVIKTDKGWKFIYENLNKLKSFLANPDNIKLHITGNIDKLCDIIPEASAALQKIIPDNLKRSVHPFQTQFDSEFMLPSNQCGIRACIVGMGSVESSYFIQATDCINDYNHPDIAAIRVFLAYFTQTEGPIWEKVQGSGFSYFHEIIFNPDEGKIYLIFYNSIHLPAAYQATKLIIDEHLSNGLLWDQTLFESAKSCVIFEMLNEENEFDELSTQSILLRLRNLKQTYNQDLIKKISLVKLEDLPEIGKKYVIPLFNPQSTITAVVCPPTNVEETANEFEKIGIKMNMYKSLDEIFLNN
ncbi:uncharacterized protein C05D11.1-like [Daktulosphaira vitifoliae]|uniref:uncharacterized protein C05D11.1-like n=1 Tax=Daktulosphaira vitifoliae TaxID=58002 RepID=UPI0021AA93C2|nr:uncharacterized protein C05D11.1-like [Daktulosphaira vitifoliae]